VATTLAEFGVNSAVEKPIGIELLERVAASEPIARKLHAIQDAQWPLQFSHVIQPAQPFLAAIIAHAWRELLPDDRQAADSTIWILCPSVHSQELLYESLLNWQPDALFLPEAEFAAAENVLPDPEIAAERLAVLLQVGRGTSRHVVVATRASLDQAAPKHGALESAVTQLQRGTASEMESQLERLVGSS
jgi:transcription-repair coupling factor (superfamily II helicase)